MNLKIAVLSGDGIGPSNLQAKALYAIGAVTTMICFEDALGVLPSTKLGSTARTT
jgi:isocitrate/isopropylmalate dehydrogenase